MVKPSKTSKEFLNFCVIEPVNSNVPHGILQLELLAKSYRARTMLTGKSSWTESRERFRENLRETLVTAGPQALADNEILMVLLSLCAPRIDAEMLADRLLSCFGSFADVIAASPQDISSVEGVSGSIISALKLINAAALRALRARIIGKNVLQHWDAILDYLYAAMCREKIEQFRVLFINRKFQLFDEETQSRGTVNSTPVYPREVVGRAYELKAAAIILCHNHPSGDPSPSRDDISMTARIQRAAKAMSITIHDHLIIGNGTWLSLRNQGLL